MDDGRTPPPPPGLTEAILRATSGPACASAEPRLCDLVDGSLDPVERELVGLHLASCEPCSSLVGALQLMSADLPMLAEIDPGADFARSVVAATAAMVRDRLPLSVRISRIADDLLQRPRIAFESAYVGAFVLMLLFGTPFSPLAGIPRMALTVASGNPIAVAREPVSRMEERISGEVQWAWAATRTTVGATSKEVAGSVAGGSSMAMKRLGGGFSGLFGALRSSGSRDSAPPGTEPDGAPGRQDEAEIDDDNDRFPEPGDRHDGDKP